MKKKIIIISTIIILMIIIVFFAQNVYKKIKNGNNISNKTTEEIINNILNMTSYDAKLSARIISNKNEHTYVLEQKNVDGKQYEQKVLEPDKLKGIIIKYDEEKLKIENTRLNLSKIYENYPYLIQNELLLNSFVEDYKNSVKSSEKENEEQIILNTNVENGNKYIKYKTLTIDKKTGKPTKLEIKDVTQNALVYILYNDIEIRI